MAAKKSRGMRSVDEARDGLEEALLEAAQVVEAFELVAGEDVPPWLFTVSRHMDRLHASAQAYMGAVHRNVRPLVDLAGPGAEAPESRPQAAGTEAGGPGRATP